MQRDRNGNRKRTHPEQSPVLRRGPSWTGEKRRHYPSSAPRWMERDNWHGSHSRRHTECWLSTDCSCRWYATAGHRREPIKTGHHTPTICKYASYTHRHTWSLAELKITLAATQNPCGIAGCGIKVGAGNIAGRWTDHVAIEMFGQWTEPLEIVNGLGLSDGRIGRRYGHHQEQVQHQQCQRWQVSHVAEFPNVH